MRSNLTLQGRVIKDYHGQGDCGTRCIAAGLAESGLWLQPNKNTDVDFVKGGQDVRRDVVRSIRSRVSGFGDGKGSCVSTLRSSMVNSLCTWLPAGAEASVEKYLDLMSLDSTYVDSVFLQAASDLYGINIESQLLSASGQCTVSLWPCGGSVPLVTIGLVCIADVHFMLIVDVAPDAKSGAEKIVDAPSVVAVAAAKKKKTVANAAAKAKAKASMAAVVAKEKQVNIDQEWSARKAALKAQTHMASVPARAPSHVVHSLLRGGGGPNPKKSRVSDPLESSGHSKSHHTGRSPVYTRESDHRQSMSVQPGTPGRTSGDEGSSSDMRFNLEEEPDLFDSTGFDMEVCNEGENGGGHEEGENGGGDEEGEGEEEEEEEEEEELDWEEEEKEEEEEE